MTPTAIRGSGFGLRFALYTVGAVTGPLAAIALMALSGDDFRLVFWIALLPGLVSIAVLMVGVKEPRNQPRDGSRRWPPLRRADLAGLRAPFWWAIAIATIFSLARFSSAFLVLKAHAVGIDAAFVPFVFVVMYLVYSAAAYPFGVLADHVDRHLQLGIGAVILVLADLALAAAGTAGTTALGAALWGLQMGMTQGLLSAAVADAAPAAARRRLRDSRSRRGIGDFCRQRRRGAAVDAHRAGWFLPGRRGARGARRRYAAVSNHAEAGSLDMTGTL